ncbi:MAG: DUF11 domain-containing protein [Planctomycetaceae bacterium]|nr:DUF11 domain-containing protein [Planctomycetaceae bacterium]
MSPLFLGGLLLCGSSCASLNRTSAQHHKPLPPSRSAQGSGVTHAFAVAAEDESSSVQQLSAAQPAVPTNDPFAQHAAHEPKLGSAPFLAIEPLEQAASVPVPIPTVDGNAELDSMDEGRVFLGAQSSPSMIQQVSAEFIVPGEETKQPDFSAVRSFLEESPPAVETSEQPLMAPEAHGPATMPPTVTAPQSAAPFPYPCEPQVELPNCPPCLTNPVMPPPRMRSFPAEVSNDEYICDGGDRELPIHYDGFQRMGLNTEDTVVEYADDTGAQHVKASNRTCIYAPRFGSVRSISGVNEDYAIARAAGAHDRAGVAGFEHRMVLDQQVQREAAVRVDMRARASGLERAQSDGNLTIDQRLDQHSVLLNAFEDYIAFREGQYERIDKAQLTLAQDAALAWSQTQPPIIQGHYRGGQTVQAKAFAQEFVGIEDRRKVGDLTITKVADKQTAASGDEITFTIRFDNVGDRELLTVRVVDNLSPRLDYIEGSVDANLPGKLDVHPNGAGSQVLTFEFTDPLPGQTGGWVSFRCTVR